MKEMEMYGIGDKKVVEGTIIYIPVRAHYGYLDFSRMYEKDMITRLTPKRKRRNAQAEGNWIQTAGSACRLARKRKKNRNTPFPAGNCTCSLRT